MIRKVVANIAITITSLLIALVIGEIGLRAFYPTPYYDTRFVIPLKLFFQHDPLLGWKGKPNTEGLFVNKDFYTHVKHNQNGHRSTVPIYAEGKRNILLLGDSYGWGWGVEQEEIFADVMMKGNPSLNIYNLSAPGYGTDQQYLALKSFLEENPDHPLDGVILLTYRNDFWDISEKNTYLPAKPRFIIEDKKLSLINYPVAAPKPNEFHIPEKAKPKINSDWRHNFHLYNFVKQSIEWQKKSRKEKQTASPNAPLPLPLKKSVPVMIEINREIKAITDANEAFFLIVMLMPQHDKKWQILKQEMSNNTIPYIEFTPKNFPQTELWIDRHLNARGHQLLADEITEAIEKL